MSSLESRALGILAEALHAIGPGEELDIDALCERHPDLAHALREAYADFRALDGIAEQVGLVSETRQREGDASGPGSEGGVRVVAESVLARFQGDVGSPYPYELREAVARGGQGVVVRAWDSRLEREIAIKRTLEPMSKALRSREELRALTRFLGEARVTSQLDHPGIVPVHEVGRDPDGHAYFTMRLVRGRTLQAIIDSAESGNSEWTLPRLVGILREVCDAVAFAHSRGIVHRDLKPTNVMVGAFGEVQVMDWGMARELEASDRRGVRVRDAASREASDDRGADVLWTRAGEVLGTPAYMPPEQARGRVEDIGPRSDVYSLGAMLYHALEGHPPFVRPGESPAPVTVLTRVLDGPDEQWVGFSESTPDELVAIAKRAMQPDPDERYSSVHELSEELRAYIEGRVVRAHRSDALIAVRKWVARHRLPVSVAAIALVLISAMSGAAWRSARAAERSDQSQRAGQILGVPLSLTVRGVSNAEEGLQIVRQDMDGNRDRLQQHGILLGVGNDPLPPDLRSLRFAGGPELAAFLLEAHYEEWRGWLTYASRGGGLSEEDGQRLANISSWIARNESSPFRRRWREVMEGLRLRQEQAGARSLLNETSVGALDDVRDIEAYGELADALGNPQEAAAAFGAALDRDPDRARCHAYLSMLGTNQRDQARHLMRWVQSAPEDLRAWTVLGFELLRSAFREQDTTLALAAMELGAQQASLENRALALGGKEGFELLLAHVNQEERPRREAFVNLGVLTGDLERVQKALPQLERGVELYPGSQSLRHNLGLCYRETKAFARAREQFVRAAELKGRASWEANTNAGEEFNRLYLTAGNSPDHLRRTVSYFERALELRPDDPRSHKSMALALLHSESLEGKRRAVDHAEKCLALGGDGQLPRLVFVMLSKFFLSRSAETAPLVERLETLKAALDGEE